MLSPYRDVLSRPGALAFSGFGVLARLPMSMVGIGIVLAVSAVYGTPQASAYGLAGRVSAVYVIVHAICSPQLAKLVDRHGQARVMRPAVVVAAVGLLWLIVAISSTASSPYLYAGAVIAGSSIGSVGAMVRARWSHVLDSPQQIHTAFSLEAALDELVFVVGPVVATWLATAVTPVSALVVPVVALLVGGFCFLAQRSTEPPPRAGGRAAGGGGTVHLAGMVVVAAVCAAMGSIFGATDVSTVAFAEEQGRKSAAGLVLAVFALGSMLSGLGYGLRNWVTPLWKRFTIGVIALAIGTSLFFLVDSLLVLALVMFVTGFTISPTLVTGNNMVQQFMPADRLTEGLTWIGTALGFGVSLGSSIAGSAIDSRGSHGGFLVVVLSAGLAVTLTLAALRSLRAGADRLQQPADAGPTLPADT